MQINITVQIKEKRKNLYYICIDLISQKIIIERRRKEGRR